jgi:hypothetical protein
MYFFAKGLDSFYVFKKADGFCSSVLIKMGLTEFAAEIFAHELNLRNRIRI